MQSVYSMFSQSINYQSEALLSTSMRELSLLLDTLQIMRSTPYLTPMNVFLLPSELEKRSNEFKAFHLFSKKRVFYFLISIAITNTVLVLTYLLIILLKVSILVYHDFDKKGTKELRLP